MSNRKRSVPDDASLNMESEQDWEDSDWGMIRALATIEIVCVTRNLTVYFISFGEFWILNLSFLSRFLREHLGRCQPPDDVDQSQHAAQDPDDVNVNGKEEAKLQIHKTFELQQQQKVCT